MNTGIGYRDPIEQTYMTGKKVELEMSRRGSVK